MRVHVCVRWYEHERERVCACKVGFQEVGLNSEEKKGQKELMKITVKERIDEMVCAGL